MSDDPMNEGFVEIDKASEILPAWFVARMMSDSWFFGLMLTTGVVLCIESITAIRRSQDGNIWIDANMLTDVPYGGANSEKLEYIGAPTSRTQVSINSKNIVAAFELADT